MNGVEPGKKVYFLSDFHLGAPNAAESLVREKKIVAFLEAARSDAALIVINGDVFDFWFEYKTVVPKHFVRLIGKLAELTDNGIEIILFAGNHDMWMRGYFEQELNIKVYFEPQTFNWNNKKFFIGHGDGLGPGDHGYKFIKKVFRNKFSQWLFSQLHPSTGIKLANYFSRRSRIRTGTSDSIFLGEDKEWLIIFCRQMLAKEHFDYFIFGHRHFPLDYKLNENSHYINLGDWITQFTYAEFNGETVALKKWEQ